MFFGRVLRTSVAAFLVLLSAASAASAEETAPTADPAPETDLVVEADLALDVERARRMIFSGDPVGALELLRALASERPGDTDILFFRGMAAAAAAVLPDDRPAAPATDADRRALFDEAAASYRAILDERPGFAAARLELARVLFERGRCLEEPDDILEHLIGDDCDAAAYHFRLALAGDLPEALVDAVSQFLAAVRARKRVSGSFSLAVAPDSNLNAATSARSYPSRLRDFFTGEALEFQIDPQTRATSGVGLVIAAGGEYRHPIPYPLHERSATRLRLGGSLYRREYARKQFDDMTLSLYAGPQLLFPRSLASVLVKAERRSYAGDPTSRALGFRVEGGVQIGERLWLKGGVERTEQRYSNAPMYDGPRVVYDIDLSWSATPAVTVGARGGWQRTRPRALGARALRTRFGHVGGYGVADLPPLLGVRGFEVGVFHDIGFTRYDAPGYFLITPHARRDRFSVTRLTAANDQLDMFGFTPTISVVHERRNTNIAEVFDYRRSRAEIAVRRLF